MLLMIAAAILAATPTPRLEARCGWLHNPTPANWWLVDRHGEWLISAQGGYHAAGLDDVPDMFEAGWVKTNGLAPLPRPAGHQRQIKGGGA
jgi:hypothetical protein